MVCVQSRDTCRIVLPVGEAVRRKGIDAHAQFRVEGQVMRQFFWVPIGKERGLHRMFAVLNR